MFCKFQTCVCVCVCVAILLSGRVSTSYASDYCDGIGGSSGEMQTWTGCASLATPVSGDFTQGPCLTDSRDGEVYQVRKFADGKCWMVENLRYGGTTTESGSDDYCLGKTGAYTKGYTDGSKNDDWYGKVGTNATDTGASETLYGDCRDPATENFVPCTTGSTVCGYLYNWQAAMQLESAYSGFDVIYPNDTPTTTNYLQGICPSGWHLPSGGTTKEDSEFIALDIANDGDGSNYQTGAFYTDFWKPTSTTSTGSNDWNGLYSGYVGYNGTFYQGGYGHWWSSRETSTYLAYNSSVSTSDVAPQSSVSKSNGLAVRCVQDPQLPTPTPTPTTTTSHSSSTSSSRSSSPASAPGCDAQRPVGTPDLFQINRQGKQATLYFTPVQNATNAYHVIFGHKDGEQRYGGISINVDSVTNHGVQSLTIHELDPKADYSFTVIPTNGCATGHESNWLLAKAAKQITYR